MIDIKKIVARVCEDTGSETLKKLKEDWLDLASMDFDSMSDDEIMGLGDKFKNDPDKEINKEIEDEKETTADVNAVVTSDRSSELV